MRTVAFLVVMAGLVGLVVATVTWSLGLGGTGWMLPCYVTGGIAWVFWFKVDRSPKLVHLVQIAAMVLLWPLCQALIMGNASVESQGRIAAPAHGSQIRLRTPPE